MGIGARTTALVCLAIGLCAGSYPAYANKPKPAPKLSAGAAYIQQIGAPADWQTDVEYWEDLPSYIPIGFPPNTQTVIADSGNTAVQTRTAPSNPQFILQWGVSNAATQTIRGAQNRTETVQISVGAGMTRKSNAGAGNGGEFDVFGFEIDPGKSGAHNSAPEPSGAAKPSVLGNISFQHLIGTHNVARAVQIGWDNVAEQFQDGSANTSIVVQLGSDNEARSDQTGSHNNSVITQKGSGHRAIVNQ